MASSQSGCRSGTICGVGSSGRVVVAASESFKAEWRAGRDHLWRIAWLICGHPDLADDIVAAAVARSWRRWEHDSVSDPGAYLRRAVVNEANDRHRSRGRDRRWQARRTGEGRGQRPVGEAVAEHADLAVALRKLPVGQRAVIVLRFWADLTEQATADSLAVSVGTVKSRTSRALAALAAELDHPTSDTTEAFDA